VPCRQLIADPQQSAIWRVPGIVCVVHTMQSRALIRLLKADGWRSCRVRGSHHPFRHPTKPGTVTVPHPKKDLGVGLVKAIRKQAGV
jgi:predicted RNA binding protein YcfA (HicA-like mRNA interferase family)